MDIINRNDSSNGYDMLFSILSFFSTLMWKLCFEIDIFIFAIEAHRRLHIICGLLIYETFPKIFTQ